MNPYHRNHYQYAPQQGQFNFPQGNYPGYSPQNQAPDFSAVYTSVQPYNSEQFLLNTFGNKPDYITVFHTLSHEDKLMLYVCTQQRKMYGEVKNKESYQRILRELAQKVQNYNNFHHGAQQPRAQEGQKEKDLEHKIDDIVEKTFEKLNLSNLNPAQAHQNKLEEVVLTEEDEEEEWVPSQEQPPSHGEPPPSPSSPLKQQPLPEKLPVNAPIFNVFTFDSQMEQALTQQIGLKPTNEKKSIWDLEVQEEELKESEPNLKEIFKSHHCENEVALKAPEQEKPSYSETTNGWRYQLMEEQRNFPSSETNYATNGSVISAFIPSQTAAQVNRLYNHTNEEDLILKVGEEEKGTETQEFGGGWAIEGAVPEKQLEDEQFVEAELENEQEQYQRNHGELVMTNSTPLEIQQRDVAPAVDLKDSFVPQPRTSNSNSNFQDYLLLDVFASTQPTPATSSNSTAKLDIKADESSTQPSKEHLSLHYTLQQAPELPTEQQPAPWLQNEQVLPFTSSSEDYSLIEGLKIDLDPKKREIIQKSLKNKSFECNPEFYLTMMDYLDELSLKASPQFQHFSEQYLIVKELHEETEKYTTAVDQDQEEVVASSIKRTKELYRAIDSQSSRTQLYTNRLLSSDNLEKGFLYKFGRLLIDSRIPQEILGKLVCLDSKEEIESSFCVVYTLEKCNSLYNLKNNGEKIMAFLNEQYEQLRCYDSRILQDIDRTIDSFPKYGDYLRGMATIALICERMIILLKTICIKPQGNLVKTLKICKDISKQYGEFVPQEPRSDLLPKSYRQAFQRAVERNSSLYELHAAFSEAYRQYPVCRVCLLGVGSKGDKIVGDDYSHFACFNLLAQIDRRGMQNSQE